MKREPDAVACQKQPLRRRMGAHRGRGMREILYLLRAFVIEMKGMTLGAASHRFFSGGREHRRHRDAAREDAGARRCGLLQSAGLVRVTAETISNAFAVEVAGLG